jgi:polyphosphate kinase 2
MAKKKEKRKDADRLERGEDAKNEDNMSRKTFESELYKLQVELCKLQEWVKRTGEKIVVIFEGRDAAGKGGVIKRITERVSPRMFRVVALPAPNDREKSQFYLQRYIAHLPAAGEIVIFDRSWYNRAGVEHVMGFCTQEEYEGFMRLVPGFERELLDAGVRLVKYFFDVSQKEQHRRFMARIEDPRKHWKLSPMDVESWRRWWDYTEAYSKMMVASDTEFAPWYVVKADNKRRARLNCISHLLGLIPYKGVPFEAPSMPKPKKKPEGVPDKPMYRHLVPETY